MMVSVDSTDSSMTFACNTNVVGFPSLMFLIRMVLGLTVQIVVFLGAGKDGI